MLGHNFSACPSCYCVHIIASSVFCVLNLISILQCVSGADDDDDVGSDGDIDMDMTIYFDEPNSAQSSTGKCIQLEFTYGIKTH